MSNLKLQLDQKIPMKIKAIILVFLIIILPTIHVNAQKFDFKYAQEITGVNKDWHKIPLHPSLYEVCKKDLKDIRVIAITNQGDSLLVPFIHDIGKREEEIRNIPVTLYNRSQNTKNRFVEVAFEGKNSPQFFNKIKVTFSERIYDTNITIEGSDDRTNWKEITSNYRLLSFEREGELFRFNELYLPESSYKFLKVKIPRQEQLAIESLVFEKIVEQTDRHVDVKIEKFDRLEESQLNTTYLDISLEHPTLVSQLIIPVKEQYDYYRRFQVGILEDSVRFKSEIPRVDLKGGKIPVFKLFHTSFLISNHRNTYDIIPTVSKHFRISILNNDNLPLKIDDIQVKGNEQFLVARFPKAEKYYLVYGNPSVYGAKFDLFKFKDNIPQDISKVTLSAKKTWRMQKEEVHEAPLFENELWLWAILIVLIGLIGYGAYSLMNS